MVYEPRGSGVIAVTRSADKTKTATFYSFADRIPRLSIQHKHSDNISLEWFRDAINVVENVAAFDLTFPKDVLELRHLNGERVLEYALSGVDGKVISSSKWSGVGVNGPRSMWGPFTHEIPRENAEAAIGVALRNCV